MARGRQAWERATRCPGRAGQTGAVPRPRVPAVGASTRPVGQLAVPLPSVVVLAAAVALAGCTSRPGGVTLRGGSDELVPCEGIDAVAETVVPVDELSSYQDCDLTGARLRFPSGELLEVGEPGSGGSMESTSVDYRVGYTNWGPDGVAAVLEEDGQVTIWGTRAGTRQQHRAQLLEDPDDVPGLDD